MIITGDSKEKLRDIASDSVDMVFTDPPYGIHMMLKDWDRVLPDIEIWRQCLRVLKPGCFAFIMSGTRADCLWRIMRDIEEAGFEISFTVNIHLYKSGFPKSMNIEKRIQKKVEEIWNSKDVKLAMGLFLKNQIEVGINILKRCFVLVNVAPKIKEGLKNKLYAIIAELNLKEANHRLKKRIITAVKNVEVNTKQQKSFVYTVAGKEENQTVLSMKEIIAQKNVMIYQCENMGDKIKEEEAPKTCFGKNPFSKETDINVNYVEVPRGLKHIILNQSKIFQNLDTNYQMELLTVMNVIITKSTKECLITYMENILTKEGRLKNSFGGYQPKPAGEVIICAMKPLTESGYLAQAMKDGKGVSWLDDCRVPHNGDNLSGGQCSGSFGNTEGWDRPWKHDKTLKDEKIRQYKANVAKSEDKGRFPANILVSDEAIEAHKYFSLDRWFEGQVLDIPKASKREKNEGLDSNLTVKYNISKEEGILCKEENMVAVQLVKKVISEWGIENFNIERYGESITAQCHKDSLSIILTEINKIIELKILNLLMHSLTKEYIPGVKSEMVNGGNRANYVGNLRKWILDITKDRLELAHGASNVALKMLHKIREKEEWQGNKNFHSTVKPVKLPCYFITLGTRPGDVILDPFMGSGTTGVAAAMLNRDFIGIELNPEYVKIAEARIAYQEDRQNREPEIPLMFDDI